MKKISKKDTITTKTKTVSKGTLKELAEIKKINSKKNESSLKRDNRKLLSIKPKQIEKTENVRTKNSKVLVKKNGIIAIDGNNKKQSKTDDQEYVMIEKSITVRQTTTKFIDDVEEEILYNEDWFGGTKLKKQNQLESEDEGEDLESILESFGSDDDNHGY